MCVSHLSRVKGVFLSRCELHMMHIHTDKAYGILCAYGYVYIQAQLKFQEMPISLKTSHIYFYYFDHIIRRVGL